MGNCDSTEDKNTVKKEASEFIPKQVLDITKKIKIEPIDYMLSVPDEDIGQINRYFIPNNNVHNVKNIDEDMFNKTNKNNTNPVLTSSSKTNYDFGTRIPNLIPKLINNKQGSSWIESNNTSKDMNLTEYLDNNVNQYHHDIIMNSKKETESVLSEESPPKKQNMTIIEELFEQYMLKSDKKDLQIDEKAGTLYQSDEDKKIIIEKITRTIRESDLKPKESAGEQNKEYETQSFINPYQEAQSDLDKNINIIKDELITEKSNDQSTRDELNNKQRMFQKMQKTRFQDAAQSSMTYKGPVMYLNENNNLYWGMYDNHKRDGKGYCVLASGEIIDGYWEQDKFLRDECYIFYPDQRVYFGSVDANFQKSDKGLLLHSCANLKTKFEHVCKSKTSSPDVLLYIGSWLKNQRHGEGQEDLRDGTIFKGHWSHGIKEGIGKVFKNNKLIFNGNYKDNKKNGEGEFQNDKGFYKGNYSDNMMQGLGKFFSVDGSKYQGQYSNNHKNGNGTFIYKDGRKYKGEFKDDKKEGKGLQWWPDGRFYKGSWANDYMHGEGKMSFPNSIVYEGNFKNDKMHDEKGILYEKIEMENDRRNKKLADIFNNFTMVGNTEFEKSGGSTTNRLIKEGHWDNGNFINDIENHSDSILSAHNPYGKINTFT